MPNTPRYGWRYQHLLEAPHGPNLGEHVALDIEETVGGIAEDVAALDVRTDAIEAGEVYEARQTLSVTAGTVTFSAIPSALRRLVVSWTARGDNASSEQHMRIQVNGLAGTNYNTEQIHANGAALSSSLIVANGASGFAGHVACATATAGLFASGEITFVGWDSPHSTFLGYTFAAQCITASGIFNSGGGTITGAGPYTSVTLFPAAGSFIAESDFQLTGYRS
jgi:hypothetical protein